MREILFRGKRVDNNEWVYGAIGYHQYREKYYICDEELENYEVIPETIGQYTGLTDKYGKKIFEGDLVNINDDIADMYKIFKSGIIEFHIGSFLVKTSDNNHQLLSLLYTLADINQIFRGEVIGNIHDKEVKE